MIKSNNSAEPTISGLPVPPSSLIGRDAEQARLADVLRRPDARLVTLLGPGGVGKTRLSIAVASEVAVSFSDGVIFVPLEGARGHGDLLASIALAIDVRESGDGDLLDLVMTHLRDRRLLLILDTFEHIIEGAETISRLVMASAGLKVLVTSRQVLNLSIEYVVPLGPFDRSAGRQDAASDPAVQLFVERARAGGGLEQDPDLDLIAQICDQLDGLPLAIELAAARTRTLSLRDLQGRLSRRLELLSGGPRDAPSRLRTMTSAISWSYDLLDAREQSLLRGVSVFADGASNDLLEEFARALVPCDAETSFGLSPLELIASLADKSLLTTRDRTRDIARRGLFDTVREFGLAQLAGEHELEDANLIHARVLTEWAERIKPLMFTPEQAHWLARAEAEHGNVRLALDRMIAAENAHVAYRLAAAIMPLWLKRGYVREGRSWTRQVLALRGPASVEARTVTLFGAASLALSAGDLDEAESHAQRSVMIATESGDAFAEGLALMAMANVLIERGNLDEAESIVERALAALDRVPGTPRAETCLGLLAEIAWLRRDYSEAESRTSRYVMRSRSSGDDWHVALAVAMQARLAGQLGRVQPALDLIKEAAHIAGAVGDPGVLADVIEAAAHLIAASPDELLAVRWCGAAAASRDSFGETPTLFALANRERLLEVATGRLGERAVEQAWSAGRAISLQAVLGELMDYETPADSSRESAQQGVAEPLTAREVEVLRLVATGKSNREIGDELYISHRTAGAHIVNILNKLGLSSRTAAAAHAIRIGIV